jgi:hypothetical protein
MMSMTLHRTWLFRCAGLWLIGFSLSVGAKPLPEDPLQRQCWLQHTTERTRLGLELDPTPVTFSNLGNGYTVRSPFWVEFGIRGHARRQ